MSWIDTFVTGDKLNLFLNIKMLKVRNIQFAYPKNIDIKIIPENTYTLICEDIFKIKESFVEEGIILPKNFKILSRSYYPNMEADPMTEIFYNEDDSLKSLKSSRPCLPGEFTDNVNWNCQYKV